MKHNTTKTLKIGCVLLAIFCLFCASALMIQPVRAQSVASSQIYVGGSGGDPGSDGTAAVGSPPTIAAGTPFYDTATVSGGVSGVIVIYWIITGTPTLTPPAVPIDSDWYEYGGGYVSSDGTAVSNSPTFTLTTAGQYYIDVVYTNDANPSTAPLEPAFSSLIEPFTIVAGPVAGITISPLKTSTIESVPVTFSAWTVDEFNNPISPVTAKTSFTVPAPGTAIGNSVSSNYANTYTVSARYETYSAFATLDVYPSSGTMEGLQYADLSGFNLAGYNLAGDKLQDANLAGATLTGAILSGADLQHADLTGAVLTGADFSGADLQYANLDGAVLTSASFVGAHLQSADLDYATLTGTSLMPTNFNRAFLQSVTVQGAIGAPDSNDFITATNAHGISDILGMPVGNISPL